MSFCSFCFGRASDRKKDSNSWRIFSLKELRSATNNFNYDNKIGEGDLAACIGVNYGMDLRLLSKRLKVWSNSEHEFAAGVEDLGRVRHKNLLSFRGYCAEGQEHLIVYDYMPNLSLYSHLHGHNSEECLLDWSRRMSIAIESAEGIAYLHQRAAPHILHRDIKASNVLLDSDFLARVADFGFRKLIPDAATETTAAKTNLGYLAPEYVNHGMASECSDVYSFGILLLELVSGKRPIEKLSPTANQLIMDWALPLARERKFSDIADPKLSGSYIEDELKRVVLVALICTENDPTKRPVMSEVSSLLKGLSKEKLLSLENEDLLRVAPTGTSQGTSTSDKASEVFEQ